MKMALSYIKSRARGVSAFLGFMLVCAIVFRLYYLPVHSVAYALILCACFMLMYACVDFLSYRRKRRALGLLIKQPANLSERLPPARGDIQRDYQALALRLEALANSERARLENAISDSNEYFAVWAHQIKTPIAGMRLMLQSDEAPDVSALTESLAGIEHYVEMAMAYQRVESPSSDYLIRAYDLDSLIAQALRKFSYQFIHKRIRLDYQPVNARVVTDKKWLVFIIEQILSNALKYTPSGTISIRLDASGALAISDSGIGISPEDLPRVFEKGYTGFNGRLDGKASGIGLNLCKRVAGRLGHEISIESKLGEGTRVTIGLSRPEFTPE